MQNLRVKLLRGPRWDSLSPDFNKRKYLMYRQCKTTDIIKKLHNWSVDQKFNETIHVNLFGRSLERCERKFALFRLIKRLIKSPPLACHNWLFIGMDKKSFENSSMKYQKLDQKNIPKILWRKKKRKCKIIYKYNKSNQKQSIHKTWQQRPPESFQVL